ncbi:S1 RNA-binding domain-containing protein [Ruminiclostridium cellulolyticum]|uniref:RNA binding S1 domain protein n=1 Tax=Ruminiclostridium cellulolyticum (strain ATCC 35319 / DSM 5812 / JCM 6584 / H10) TaxID=394503 RepID=B8I046_RUMCH|nr:S1 RNA-binding domain-containing protein [Ruminiclostridium cellulolyticum]ACL77372.1 RNA binding S1 domain protein [Ruminiclostridium cellulolyticum H10]
MPLEVGKIVEGKVTGITAFGAFVQLPEGKTGLVHISEVAQEYVKDVSAHLKENQIVKVKILSVDTNGKVSLSIKKAMAGGPTTVPKFRPPAEVDWNAGKNNSVNVSFEDRLAKFMKDSDEKLHDLKKSVESKRGSSGYRKSAQY